MKILVKSGGRTNFRLILPTGLAMNPVTAALMPKMMEQNGITITAGQARAFFRAVKAYKKTHPDWNLVEVESTSGEYVMIRL